LKTDYFHAKAYPTSLYYNPYSSAKTVKVELGSDATDIYDAISDQFLQKNAHGHAHITIPADTARIVVLTPAGGNMMRGANRTLIDNVIVRYGN
jgi:hypothetical protein